MVLIVFIREKAQLSGNLVYHLLLRLACVGVHVFRLRYRAAGGFAVVRFAVSVVSFILFVVTHVLFRLGKSYRFQLLYAFYVPCGYALAFGLEAFYGDKLFGIYLQRFPELVRSVERDFYPRVNLVGEQHRTTVGVVSQIALLAPCGLHLETLYIWVSVIVRIEQHGRPHFGGIEFLYYLNIVLVVVVHVEVGEIELAVGQYHQYHVVVIELSQQRAVVIIVQSLHVGVEPNLAPAER